MHLYENLKGKSVMPLPSDQEFEKRWMTVELYVMLKQLFFYAYIYIYITTSFVGGILLWTNPVMIIYSNLCKRQLSKLK